MGYIHAKMKLLYASNSYSLGKEGRFVWKGNDVHHNSAFIVEKEASETEKDEALKNVKLELKNLGEMVNKSKEVKKISDLPIDVQVEALCRLSRNENILDDDKKDNESLTAYRDQNSLLGSMVNIGAGMYDKFMGTISGNAEIGEVVNSFSDEALMRFVTANKEAALELFSDVRKEVGQDSTLEYEIKFYGNKTLEKNVDFFDLLPKEYRIIMLDEIHNTYAVRTPTGYRAFHRGLMSLNDVSDPSLKVGEPIKMKSQSKVRIYRSIEDIPNHNTIKENYEASKLAEQASHNPKNQEKERNMQVNRHFTLNFRSLLDRFKVKLSEVSPGLKQDLEQDIEDLEKLLKNMNNSKEAVDRPEVFAEYFMNKIQSDVNIIVKKIMVSDDSGKVKKELSLLMKSNFESVKKANQSLLNVNRRSLLRLLGLPSNKLGVINHILKEFDDNPYFTESNVIKVLKDLGIARSKPFTEKEIRNIYNLLKSRARLGIQSAAYEHFSVATIRAISKAQVEVIKTLYIDDSGDVPEDLRKLFNEFFTNKNFTLNELTAKIRSLTSLNSQQKKLLYERLKDFVPSKPTQYEKEARKELVKSSKKLTVFQKIDRKVDEALKADKKTFFEEIKEEVNLVIVKRQVTEAYRKSYPSVSTAQISPAAQQVIDNAARVAVDMPAFTISRFNEVGLPVFEVGQTAQEVVVDKENDEMYPANIDSTGTMSDFVKFPVKAENIPGIQITGAVTDGNFWTADYGVTNANRSMGVSKTQNIFRQIYPLGDTIALNEDVINGWKNLQIELRARGRGMPYFWKQMGVVDKYGELLDEKGGDIALNVRNAIASARVGNFDWLDNKNQVDGGLYEGVLAKDYGFDDRLVAQFGVHLKNSKVSVVNFMKQHGLYDEKHTTLDPKFKNDHTWLEKWKTSIKGL